jgi:uncharacterized protein YycO
MKKLYITTLFMFCLVLFISMIWFFTESGISGTSGFVSQEHQNLSYLNIVQSGSLVFRQGSGMASRIVDTLDSKSTFSHIGIVYIQHKDVFVVHVEPQGLEFVEMESFENFINQSKDFAIYIPDHSISKAGKIAAQKAVEWVGKKRFDREFDLEIEENFYCTELVYKAYLKAGVDIIQENFHLVKIPFLGTKNVIYPSSFIESGMFIPSFLQTQEEEK